MEEKEQYTFEELCEGLEISMSKFAKLADVDEGTIARIRKGHFVRIGTINRLLRAFSEVYRIKFTTENVSGLKKVEKPITPIAEKATSPPVSSQPITAISQPASPQIRDVEPKRTYKPRKTDLPEGCILAIDFARNHDVKRETFRDHMLNGLGPGLIGYATDTIPQRDQVAYSERPKPGREKETERYLNQEQQHAALEFWKRHDVDYSECDQPGCYCHTLKQEN